MCVWVWVGAVPSVAPCTLVPRGGQLPVPAYRPRALASPQRSFAALARESPFSKREKARDCNR